MREDFIAALKKHQSAFKLDLPDEALERLAAFYDLVQEHNPILHLTGPITPEEFALRHVLESLTLLNDMPFNAKFVDIGPGGGFPSIPCLLVRESMSAVLIESSLKKANFLREVLAKCELEERAEIVNQQFTEVRRPYVLYVTCRALDKFTKRLPAILKWSGDCNLLFFGGPALGDELKKLGIEFRPKLMPMSEQRYLFVADGRDGSVNADERAITTKPELKKPRAAAAKPRTAAEPRAAKPRTGRPGAGNPRDTESRDRRPGAGRPRDTESRSARPGAGRPRDPESRDRGPSAGRPRDAESRDRRPGTGRPRDPESRDRRPAAGRPRDPESRSARPGAGRPRDAESRDRRPVADRPKDTESRRSRPGTGRPRDTESRSNSSPDMGGTRTPKRPNRFKK